jgi:hypothetical protein
MTEWKGVYQYIKVSGSGYQDIRETGLNIE